MKVFEVVCKLSDLLLYTLCILLTGVALYNLYSMLIENVTWGGAVMSISMLTIGWCGARYIRDNNLIIKENT